MKILKHELKTIHELAKTSGTDPEYPLLLFLPSKAACDLFLYDYIEEYGILDIYPITVKDLAEKYVKEEGHLLSHRTEDVLLAGFMLKDLKDPDRSLIHGAFTAGNCYREIKSNGGDPNRLPKGKFSDIYRELFCNWEEYLEDNHLVSSGDLFLKGKEYLENGDGYKTVCFFGTDVPFEEENFVKTVFERSENVYISEDLFQTPFFNGLCREISVHIVPVTRNREEGQTYLYPAGSLREEVREIFRNILRDIAKGGNLTNHRIIVRNRSTMAFIQSMADRLSIPVGNGVSRSIGELPPGREFMDYLSFISDPSKDNILKRCESNYFSLPFPVESETVELLKDLEFEDISSGITALSSITESEFSADAIVEGIKLLTFLREERSRYEKSPESLKHLFRDFNIYSNLFTRDCVDYIKRDFQCFRHLEDLFQPFEDFPFLWNFFNLQTLYLYFSEMVKEDVLRTDPNIEGVKIFGPEESLGIFSEYTYLPEYNEEVPRPETGHYFLTKDIRKGLKMREKKLSDDFLREENILEDILNHSGYVFLSYTKNRVDDEGSMLLNRLKVRLYDPETENPYSAVTEEEARIRVLSKGGDLKEFDLTDVWSYPEEKKENIPLKGIEPPKTYDATRMESYGNCPFHYFMSYVLDAEPLEEESEYQTVGKVLHSVLAKYYRIRKSEGNFNPDEDLIKELISTEMMVENVEDPLIQAYLEDKLIDFIREDFLHMKKTGFYPMYFEKACRFSFRGFPFTVRIDRIDQNKEGREIILDYKSSPNQLPGTYNIWTREAYQLPIYCWARDNGRIPVGAGYGIIKTGEFSYPIADKAFLPVWGAKDSEKLKEKLEEKALQLEDRIQRLRKGYYAPVPIQCSEYCPYQYMCRKEEYVEK